MQREPRAHAQDLQVVDMCRLWQLPFTMCGTTGAVVASASIAVKRTRRCIIIVIGSVIWIAILICRKQLVPQITKVHRGTGATQARRRVAIVLAKYQLNGHR